MQSKQCEAMPLRKRIRSQCIAINLPGKISPPAEGELIDCWITNLCSSGARVSCKQPPLLQTSLILHVDGFGSFECATSRYVKDGVDLRFVGKQARRRRILADIVNFVDEGARLRRRQNMPSTSEIRFTRPHGEQFRGAILDSTPQRLLLQTSIQPPVGEIVHVGQTYGRVAVHYKNAIAILLLRAESENDASRDIIRRN